MFGNPPPCGPGVVACAPPSKIIGLDSGYNCRFQNCIKTFLSKVREFSMLHKQAEIYFSLKSLTMQNIFWKLSKISFFNKQLYVIYCHRAWFGLLKRSFYDSIKFSFSYYIKGYFCSLNMQLLSIMSLLLIQLHAKVYMGGGVTLHNCQTFKKQTNWALQKAF